MKLANVLYALCPSCRLLAASAAAEAMPQSALGGDACPGYDQCPAWHAGKLTRLTSRDPRSKISSPHFRVRCHLREATETLFRGQIIFGKIENKKIGRGTSDDFSVKSSANLCQHHSSACLMKSDGKISRQCVNCACQHDWRII